MELARAFEPAFSTRRYRHFRVVQIYCGISVALMLLAIAAPRAAAAQFIGPYPFAVGDSFVFAYTSSTSVQQGTAKPSVTNQAYTETTTILPAIAYTSPPGSSATIMVYPYKTTAAATTSAGKYTLTLIEYRNFLTRFFQVKLVEYGYSRLSDLVQPDNVDQQSNTTVGYDVPGMLDQLPAVPGHALPLPLGGSETINDRYLSGSTASNLLQRTRKVASDGSYADVGTDVDVPFTLAQHADGTGDVIDQVPSAVESWNFGLPGKGGAGYTIPVQVSFEGKTDTNQVPDWFPGHAATTLPLVTNTLTDLGLRTTPAACGKYAAKKARLIRRDTTQLGPVEGFIFAETEDYYVMSGVGRVCIQDNQSETDYDSRTSGAVTQIEKFSSTESLVSETLR